MLLIPLILAPGQWLTTWLFRVVCQCVSVSLVMLLSLFAPTNTVPTPLALPEILSWVPTPVALRGLRCMRFRFGHTWVGFGHCVGNGVFCNQGKKQKEKEKQATTSSIQITCASVFRWPMQFGRFPKLCATVRAAGTAGAAGNAFSKEPKKGEPCNPLPGHQG